MTTNIEVVLLKKLKEVHIQEIGYQADMIPEQQVVPNSKQIADVVGIVFGDEFQDFDLDESLLVEFLTIANNLQCAFLLLLMIVDLNHLPEGALAEGAQHLVAVGDVVVLLPDIVCSIYGLGWLVEGSERYRSSS